MERLGVPEDMPIQNGLISKSIESAQGKVEGYNFDIRKHLLEYDDVMNKHRQVIYKKREEILELSKVDPERKDKSLRKKILEMVECEIEQVVLFHTSTESKTDWDLEEIYEVMGTIFPVSREERVQLDNLKNGSKNEAMESRSKIIQYLIDLADKSYDKLEEKIEKNEVMAQIEKSIILRAIDTLWIEHLEQMDYLRTGIGLRGYGQRDPLIEYKDEAYKSFTQLMNTIQSQIVYSVYKIGLAKEMVPSAMQKLSKVKISAPSKTMQEGRGGFSEFKNKSAIERQSESQSEDLVPKKIIDKSGHKVGRNDPCPCGATKPDGKPVKYKHCHGKNI